MKKITLLLLLPLLFVEARSQEYFPGGVAGAETWYMAEHEDFTQNIFKNYGYRHIRITACQEGLGKGLLNFNHAIATEKLCLAYNAPVENSTTRNIFFVGEPKVTQYDLSHVTTAWNPMLASLPQTDSIIRNRFDLSMESAYRDKIFSTHQSLTNAHINFYHWNNYQSDKKFKSYGYQGETAFYIGREFINPETEAKFFVGNFPEYISFPFELSTNQRNRVESYLALKYGITLNLSLSYRNSKNVVFWNKSNNGNFGNRIFGIGRDDVSWLNQLESESAHAQNYLVASVEKLVPTNKEKQELVSIPKDHFIVFGDNGKDDALEEENDFKVRTLSRKWLSQNTGEGANHINMFFKLDLAGVLQQALSEDPHLKLWMLHDKYVTNQEVSDFNSQYVEYYDPANMDALLYAYFENVFFDPDTNIYDQFTFGVGPEMIVQARFHEDCDDNKIKTDVVITGGKAHYDINIQNTNGLNQNYTINNNVLTFEAVAPDTYTIYVLDSAGNEAEIEVEVIYYQIIVDLGPDIVFSINQQQATLDAGQNVNDPEATYQWYKDGVLLEHYDPVLVVTEPGEYKVVVTSSNQACRDEDTIRVDYNFTGTAQPSELNCSASDGYITLQVSGGIPPFTTHISGPETVNQVHNTENYVFNNLEFGQYSLTTTDINGEVFQANVTLVDPLEGIEMTLIDQLFEVCEFFPYNNMPTLSFLCYSPTPIYIDAAAGVTNPNVTYEWFMNGNSMGIYDPYVQIIQDTQLFPGIPGDTSGYNEFVLQITNLETGCTVTEAVGMVRFYGIIPAQAPLRTIADNAEAAGTKDSEDTSSSSIATKVYPNPSDSGDTFYYEATSPEVFDGTVEIFTTTGVMLEQVPISGKAGYTLTFSLTSSGTYYICTRANGNLITNKVIIK